MKKKRNMQLLLVSMHTIALCLAGCSGEDEDIKNHVDNDEVFTSLHVHPKGLYVARIIAFEKSGNPVTVVESAPEMSTISPWPIVNDTVVVENQMNGMVYEEGYLASFQIKECQWIHPKYISMLGRKWKWSASVEAYVKGNENADNGEERYLNASYGYVDYITKFPRGDYEGVFVVVEDGRRLMRITKAPVAAQDSLWPTVNDTLSLENLSLHESDIHSNLSFLIESCAISKSLIYRRNPTFWLTHIVIKE